MRMAATPARIASAGGPPEWCEDYGDVQAWDDDFVVPGDPQALPESEYDYDQRVAW